MGRHEKDSIRADDLGGGPEGPNVELSPEGTLVSDLSTADAQLTEEPAIDDREPAGDDEWLTVEGGAGILPPPTRENWRPT